SFSTATSPAHSSTLSLHDALPISVIFSRAVKRLRYSRLCLRRIDGHEVIYVSPMHSRFSRLRGRCRSAFLGHLDQVLYLPDHAPDRKSTRLNSSHVKISYAGFCLK